MGSVLKKMSVQTGVSVKHSPYCNTLHIGHALEIHEAGNSLLALVADQLKRELASEALSQDI